MTLRLKFNPETTKLDPPRFCYKYNRTMNGREQAQINKKNAKALLYIDHEDFYNKMMEIMLEPIDAIRTHLVNEGITENSHKKFLEIQIMQKKKELFDLESQLNNMKLIDELD